MYTFVRAIAVEIGANKRWGEVDISSTPTSNLFTQYREIYIVVTHPLFTEEMTINLDDIAEGIQNNVGTISDYLTANGNGTLPTTVGTPTIVRNHAIFSDVFKAGFDVDTTNMEVGEGVILSDDDKPDVVLRPTDRSDGYDYIALQKRVIANVNGFYHQTAADSRGLYVKEANVSRRLSKENYLGLLSFGTFGEVQSIPITEDMLAFEVAVNTNQVDKVHVLFSDSDMTQKTPILILGGYMVMLDNDSLLLTNSNILTFKTFKYPFAERYFESKNYLNFEPFDVQHTTDNPDFVKVGAFRQMEFLKKYFTMGQSFLVLVDTTNLVTEMVYPETQTVPHTYMHWGDQHNPPKWPLVVGEGKHEVYWSQYEAGSWVIRCHDTYKRNYMFRTTPTKDQLARDNVLYMGDAGYYGDAHFLKIIDEQIEIRTQ